MKYHVYKHKDMFIRGQCANTHATGIINNADNQIDALAAKYNLVKRRDLDCGGITYRRGITIC
jgi:hypothetical protein